MHDETSALLFEVSWQPLALSLVLRAPEESVHSRSLYPSPSQSTDDLTDPAPVQNAESTHDDDCAAAKHGHGDGTAAI